MLYGHVFRNAMLIVIAGFPAAFIGVLFTGSLLIEVIFSLDGLGLLGFEAAINRDYPVMFGTLYIFTLLGLLMGICSATCMYIVVDPRIDFEARGLMRSPLDAPPPRDLPRQPARRLVARRSSACCSSSALFAELHRQRPADPRPLRRRLLLRRCSATIPRRPSAAIFRPTPTTRDAGRARS